MTDSIKNYSQLIELAVLDAHGLLESIESDLFNQSFHDAPASVQDEIIRMQYEFATDESLLPTDMPPTELRQKVIDAVAEAADKEAQRLAPLALIGARASAALGQYGSSSSVTFWRTAAIILFGISVLFGYLTVDANKKTSRITEIALSNDANDTLKDLAGAEFKNFINNPFCRITRLEREHGDPSGYIRVALHERTGEGFVIGIDLAKGEEIIITGTTTDGEVIELAKITADGPVAGRKFHIDPSLVIGLTITAINSKTNNRWI